MKTHGFIFLFSLCSAFCSAGEPGAGEPVLELLPPGRNFASPRGSFVEPRIGVFKMLNSSDMKVDIGNSVDVLGLSFPSRSIRVTAGIDFMAYALTQNIEGFRLQLDAIDGFFGGNIAVSRESAGETFQARLRLVHQSAHLVDGHYDQIVQSWTDNRLPVPFTRDFGELTLSRSAVHGFGVARTYAGFSYATLVRPSDIRRFSCSGGAEVYLADILGAVSGRPLNVFGAYNISLSGEPEYRASHQFQLGVKLGTWDEKGAAVFLAYYTGRHPFSEYYDLGLSGIGLGFTVDFF